MPNVYKYIFHVRAQFSNLRIVVEDTTDNAVLYFSLVSLRSSWADYLDFPVEVAADLILSAKKNVAKPR